MSHDTSHRGDLQVKVFEGAAECRKDTVHVSPTAKVHTRIHCPSRGVVIDPCLSRQRKIVVRTAVPLSAEGQVFLVPTGKIDHGEKRSFIQRVANWKGETGYVAAELSILA